MKGVEKWKVGSAVARGTVIKRNKSWSVVLDFGKGADGKRQRQWRSGYKTKKEAEIARTNLLSSKDRGLYVANDDLTIKQFVDEFWLPFLDQMVDGGTLKESTTSNYRHMVASYVVPEIGQTKLVSLSATSLNTLYAKLLKSGRKNLRGSENPGLSATTVRLVHRTIHRMLKDAMDWDMLAKNVAVNASPPKNKQEIQKVKAWSPQELKVFISATRDDRLGAAWLLFCTTGLRRGEVAGLKWSDIDLVEGCLKVERTFTVIDHKVVVSTPKTTASGRLLALDGETVKALKSLKATQSSERLAWGAAYKGQDLIFVREDGSPVHPRVITRTFQRIVREIALPKIPLHGLRHSYATAALEAGVPLKVVSERLGHSSIRITGDIYSHVRPEVDKAAAALVADLILGTA